MAIPLKHECGLPWVLMTRDWQLVGNTHKR